MSAANLYHDIKSICDSSPDGYISDYQLSAMAMIFTDQAERGEVLSYNEIHKYVENVLIMEFFKDDAVNNVTDAICDAFCRTPKKAVSHVESVTKALAAL